jgi:hypothetical protein
LKNNSSHKNIGLLLECMINNKMPYDDGKKKSFIGEEGKSL